MFITILKQIVEEVPGAQGAILMGFDGIAVAEFSIENSSTDMLLLTVEYANALKEIRKSSSVLEIGEMEEVVVSTDRFTIILRALTDEYFCALLLSCDAQLGKGRYVLHREQYQLCSAVA